MTLTLGSRLGVFQLIDLIGRGGMGEVYRARDTKLDRDVAIKILPDAFARDAERLARFTREAKTLASLNHPNIAAIYGLEESGGMTALVMELVEGDDLSQRIIAKGAIPIDEALPIAKQIAEALEAAHEQGIIHRDLKPANIKVRPDGTVKVLDFGLAKAMEPAAGSSPSLSMSPTITTPAMTQAGMILGTAAYMSPEQAKGRTVDRRTDVWAFGAVLYEMLTGKRAFAGEDVSDTLAHILMKDPDWTALPTTVPSAVVAALRRCLQKDRKQRVRDTGDVSLALEGAFETIVPQATPPTTSSADGGRRVWMAAFGVAVLGIIALAIPAVRHLRETPLPETRVDIVTSATDQPTSFALSPDGRQIVFAASGDGSSRLWLRSLGTTPAQPLAGTEGAIHPFWSPDGRSVAFFAGNALKRLDLDGGSPRTLAPAVTSYGGTWNADGVILFTPELGPLFRINASGGEPVPVTKLDRQTSHRLPLFLPDGRHFLFFAIGGAPDTTGIYLGALDGGTPTRLTPADGSGVYFPAGWLLWVRGSTLVAQRLDVAKAALTGEPMTVADGVGIQPGLRRSAVSVAGTGLLAYRASGVGRRQLTWVDGAGTVRGTVGEPDATLASPRVSPDGHRVAVERTVQGNTDIWLLDGGRVSRLTFDAAGDVSPVWSPDGTRIAFASTRTGSRDVYQKLTSGAGVDERLVASNLTKNPLSWSADGRFVLYHTNDPKTGYDLWLLPMVGDHAPSVFLKTPFFEARGAFSPDGRWVAFQSNASGRPEIYIRPFVPPGAADTSTTGGQWQVSTAGGIAPAWRPDGKELYYLNPAGALVAAPITVTGATLAPGAPVVLFPTLIAGGGVEAALGRQYDVAPDGRFLINTELDSAVAPITLLMNWNPDAKK